MSGRQSSCQSYSGAMSPDSGPRNALSVPVPCVTSPDRRDPVVSYGFSTSAPHRRLRAKHNTTGVRREFFIFELYNSTAGLTQKFGLAPLLRSPAPEGADIASDSEGGAGRFGRSSARVGFTVEPGSTLRSPAPLLVAVTKLKSKTSLSETGLHVGKERRRIPGEGDEGDGERRWRRRTEKEMKETETEKR